jgi:putative PIN family toxin of toxin-antitoxin system
MKTKFVFDTNVLLSATLWDGSVAQKLLFKLIKADIQIFSSQEILEEYKKILKRDFDYSNEEINEIMGKVLQFLNLVSPNEKVEVVKEDVDDNKIIECALESKAEYILSYDKHLLNLKEYFGIKIIKPEEAFKILE